MKTRLGSLLALVVALDASALAAPSTAADAFRSAFAFNVEVVSHSPAAEIERGTTQMTVLRLLGPAQRELSREVWAYAGYRPHVDRAIDHRCDTLLISFTDGRVSDLKIVNAAAASIIAARLRFTASPVLVTKK